MTKSTDPARPKSGEPSSPADKLAARVAAYIISLRNVLHLLAALREKDGDFWAIEALSSITYVQRLRGSWEAWESLCCDSQAVADERLGRYLSWTEIETARTALWDTSAQPSDSDDQG